MRFEKLRTFFHKLLNKKTKEIITGRDSRRSFTITQKKAIWYDQKGKCNLCSKRLDMRTVIYDHRKRWSDGGRSDMKNGQALCPGCNNMKNYKENLNSAEIRRIKGRATK